MSIQVLLTVSLNLSFRGKLNRMLKRIHITPGINVDENGYVYGGCGDGIHVRFPTFLPSFALSLIANPTTRYGIPPASSSVNSSSGLIPPISHSREKGDWWY